MIRSIEVISKHHDIESVLVQTALGRIKDLLEASQTGSYASLCGVLWNLKFYRAAIGEHVGVVRGGEALLSQIEDLDQEIRKTVRPKLMRRSVELLTTQEQLLAYRELADAPDLELPGKQ